MEKNRIKIITPACTQFNIYKHQLRRTTALGPIYVATAADKLPNWRAEVIDENNCHSKIGRKCCPKDKNGLPDHKRLQEKDPARAVGFYCSLSSTIPRVFALARQYKEMGVVTIAGGRHVSVLPEEALANGIDIVCVGDGEEVIREVLTALENNQPLSNIKGIMFKNADGTIVKTEQRASIVNLCDLPLPDFSLVRYAKLIYYPVSWWRGCNMKCEFCMVNEAIRTAPAECLYQQIVNLFETRGAIKFFIVDDHFGGDLHKEDHRAEAIRFCQMIAEYQKSAGIRFDLNVQMRLDDAKYPDMIAAMQKAGVHMVCIGYESPIDEELRAMRKGYTAKDMLLWTKIFINAGFFVHGMFIFGYPQDQDAKAKNLEIPIAERAKRFISFIKRSRMHTAQILLPVPLPGTKLRARLEEQSRLYPLEHIGWEFYDGQFVLFEPDNGVSPEELQRAVTKIMSSCYNLRHFFHVVFALVIGFPTIVFPSVLTLILFKVRHIKSAFNLWRRYFWRTEKIRFLGYFVIQGWLAKFKRSDFLLRLEQARQRILKKQN
jgi:radical SAM superfamily enzyme YgiQ (UPF0313 family)